MGFWESVKKAGNVLAPVSSMVFDQATGDRTGTLKKSKEKVRGVQKKAKSHMDNTSDYWTDRYNSLQRGVSGYFNPDEPSLDTSIDPALAAQLREEEARRRARRFGRSMLMNDSTASGVSLGV